MAFRILLVEEKTFFPILVAKLLYNLVYPYVVTLFLSIGFALVAQYSQGKKLAKNHTNT